MVENVRLLEPAYVTLEGEGRGGRGCFSHRLGTNPREPSPS
jgi:hypothetical protein